MCCTCTQCDAQETCSAHVAGVSQLLVIFSVVRVFTRFATPAVCNRVDSLHQKIFAPKEGSGGTSVLRRHVPTFSSLGICVVFARRISFGISCVPVADQTTRRQSRDAFCFTAFALLAAPTTRAWNTNRASTHMTWPSICALKGKRTSRLWCERGRAH